ncbi:MAG TPA: hypothetical protein VK348_04660 [Planctomycetota bacterium]|nr:hypothetical protein [Planctomycetota bacterium]
MKELLQAALPFLLPALLPALLLLFAPLWGSRARTVSGIVLLVLGAGFVVDVLTSDHSQPRALTVPNVFPRGPLAEPYEWLLATETAPAWQYHIWLAAVLMVPALVLLLRRKRAPHAPSPVLYCIGIFLFYEVARLGLEKTAAPVGLVWAVGASPALLLSLPFFGWYCGLQGVGFGRFLGRLLLLGYLQRLPLVALAYVATTRALGTHLDTHTLTDIHLRPFAERQFPGDPVASWLWPTCVPQLTMWILITLVAGIVLGTGPLLVARRRSAANG